MKKILLFVVSLIVCLTIVSCRIDAIVASKNLAFDADSFKIYGRVIFYNGITDEYILQVEGYCSIYVDPVDNQLEVTIKIDEGTYLKHFLGLSDNVTYFAEQLDPAKVSDKRYKVVFKPSTIIPDIEVR